MKNKFCSGYTHFLEEQYWDIRWNSFSVQRRSFNNLRLIFLSILEQRIFKEWRKLEAIIILFDWIKWLIIDTQIYLLLQRWENACW